VAVRASSAFHATLEKLRSRVPLEILTVPEHLDAEQILARVAEGQFDSAVADKDLLDAVLTYRDDLKEAFALTEPRPIGWAMRRDSTRLKSEVDKFLHENALIGQEDVPFVGDLEEIQERKVLRVLTRNNAATTYLHRGRQVGFEYELARRFARSIGCRLEVVIPPEFGDLIPWLLEGRGDLIAASMTATPARQERVSFARPHLTARQTVVKRADGTGPDGPEDLAGRRITVRPSSTYFETLKELRDGSGIALEIDPAPESVETEDLIAGVAEGRYELTVADSHILGIELSWRDDVEGAFEIGPPEEIAWAVRPDASNLLQAADGFLTKHGKGSRLLNVLKEKYLADQRQVSRRVRERPEISGQISQYDDLFRKYGEEVGIDWRLLAAQAYQESGFDKTAKSTAGARGIMQLLPRTMRELRVRGDLDDPEVGIRAGALYMKKLSDRYGAELPMTERLRFALGAYNAGPGHILDARRVARQEGLDPDVWFENVERALPLLSRSGYASAARYGYCRCWEPVRYVREIHERYRSYTESIE
jgi:membrane-bound lytic murein transglycosylase F